MLNGFTRGQLNNIIKYQVFCLFVRLNKQITEIQIGTI